MASLSGSGSLWRCWRSASPSLSQVCCHIYISASLNAEHSMTITSPAGPHVPPIPSLTSLLCRAGYFIFRWWRKYQADKKQAEYITKVSHSKDLRCSAASATMREADLAGPSLCPCYPEAEKYTCTSPRQSTPVPVCGYKPSTPKQP